MKYLITGGAGFIGSQMADILLSRGHEVINIDNMSWGRREFIEHNLKNPRYTFIESDLLDYSTLVNHMKRDIDIVFHFAANSDIQRGGVDPTIDFNNTTLATFNVLQAMRVNGIEKILYTSGSGVYGDVGSIVTSETYGPLLPVSVYGATKLSAEGMISAFSNLYDIQAWIFRPANIIGPRATHGVVFDLVNKLRKDPKHLKILGDGKQSKSYLYLQDVLDAFDLVLEKSDDRINLFNIASNSHITVTEIAKAVIKGIGLKDVKITYTGGNIGWKGDVPVVRLDSSKLEKLGWKCKYNSRQAVEETIKNII
jgi:UDP-glucose 4-epimerase